MSIRAMVAARAEREAWEQLRKDPGGRAAVRDACRVVLEAQTDTAEWCALVKLRALDLVVLRGERQRVEPADLAELKRLAEKTICDDACATFTEPSLTQGRKLAEGVLDLVERVAACNTEIARLQLKRAEEKRGRLAAEARETQLREALEEIIETSRDFPTPEWYAVMRRIEDIARAALVSPAPEEEAIRQDAVDPHLFEHERRKAPEEESVDSPTEGER